jgi:FkbM family methyltransferase
VIRWFLGSLLRRGLAPLGFELRRRPVGHVWGADPFADQRELLGANDVRSIFDIGANCGQTTAKYRELFPAADIHAFEPFPDSLAQFQRAHADSPRVHTHPLAVADRAGRRTFHLNESHYTNSLLPSAADAGRFVGPGLLGTVGRIEVETVSLDGFCADRCIERIDILKIDVQGGEGLVLAGASGLLAAKTVRLIYSEVQFAPMYAGQANLWDVHSALDRTGYQLFGLYNVVHAGKEGIAWADVVYLPK